MRIKPVSTNPSRRSFLLQLLFFAAVLFLPSSVSAQSDGDDCVTRVFNDSYFPLWEIPRYFSLSTSAPVAEYYRNNLGERQKITRVFELLETLVDIMDNRRKRSDESACNLHRELDWVKAMYDAAQKRQMIDAQTVVDDSCPSRLDFSKDEAEDDFDSNLKNGVRAMLRDAIQSMAPAVESISESPWRQNLANWTQTVFPLSDWDLRRISQQCDLQTVSAYRANSRLYLRVAVTNRPVDSFVLDYDRQVFEEWVRDDLQDSLRMTQPRLQRAGPKLDKRSDWEISSSLLEKWSGRAGLASHGNMFMEDNPAINEALRQNSVAIDLAEDAIAASNIAILALPLTMNLIPVAFLAELSTSAMLAYIVFTDVFSTLPFLVKGVELIRAVDNERLETVAFYMGNSTFGEIELWSATCKGEDKFHAIGVSFVAIAVIAIVVGVFLEVFAARVMRRRRIKDGASAEGPFGRAAFDATKLSLLGSGTDKDGLERRYSIDADDIDAESDTDTRPSSNESNTAEERRWWRWGSQNTSSVGPVLTVKVMPSVGSDFMDGDVIPRDEAFSSNEEISRETMWDESDGFMDRLRKIFGFLGRRNGDRSQGFTVGVGSDGMSSAERAARENGSDEHSYGYDEAVYELDPRRDSSMV
eukprot:TRINITY_DN267_c0_g1_i1.p1 TRINITY_DN267_c0_g1~~TRINITY_DN267_c0_g1_i1.p1  ORF type:complete len:642 (+),score=104.57 TRINITY_DN267_c0_g1_i1:1188-3113(+)